MLSTFIVSFQLYIICIISKACPFVRPPVTKNRSVIVFFSYLFIILQKVIGKIWISSIMLFLSSKLLIAFFELRFKTVLNFIKTLRASRFWDFTDYTNSRYKTYVNYINPAFLIVPFSSNFIIIYFKEHKERKHYPKLEECPHCMKEMPAIDIKRHIRKNHTDSGICNVCGVQV